MENWTFALEVLDKLRSVNDLDGCKAYLLESNPEPNLQDFINAAFDIVEHERQGIA